MSSETKTIILKKPLQAPEGEVKQLVFREPTFDEYLIHGDPYTVASSKEGNPFVIESADVIAAYIKVCLVEPKDPAILSQGKARLGKEVKETVLSFFRPDFETAEASGT